ncbi:MAG: lytic transglycosylase domain-containing protein [Alphaproteobacteria bacterium]|nr:lytic transglycosylase domain-containing protein [Alphaproteobacteria bacterium]
MSINNTKQAIPLWVGLFALLLTVPPVTGKAKPLAQNIPVPETKPLATKVIAPTPKLKPVRTSLAQNIPASKPPHSIQRATKRWQQNFMKNIEKHVRLNRPTYALSLLQKDGISEKLSPKNFDHLRSLIAFSYLFENQLNIAKDLAEKSLERSGPNVPLAGWVLGLVHWQSEEFLKAAQAFETTAKSSKASEWTISAASYWAARAYMRSGQTDQVRYFLELAAAHPRTFYGLIATRALGQKISLNWSEPRYKRRYLKALKKYDGGKEAHNLIKEKKYAQSERILRNISFEEQDRESMLALAHHYNMPALLMDLGQEIKNKKGKIYNTALYPVPSWIPKGGERIDPALLYAIARQESRFRTGAKSSSGATGLMQLMPATAHYINGQSIYANEKTDINLEDPETNLEIGQTYIERLLNFPSINQDLVSLTVAYNAGPGTLARWKEQHAHITDPLLFVEMIPYPETRAFVERVMANYWIYRTRMRQKTPSLDAIAHGNPAYYTYEKRTLFDRIASNR